MKDHKVKALRRFNDTVENELRKPGDTFNCTEERYLFLKEHNAVELVEKKEEVIATEPEEEQAVEEPKPKKKTTKKK